MSDRTELKWAAGIAAGFLALYFLPLGGARAERALVEAFELAGWYAHEHVLPCLIPAFFIAGAISVFVSQASVLRYLGGGAPRPVAYGVASVSGSVLAVCSCTVLPLFGGIYKRGAGLGPAATFLYAGPAINVLAIILTSRVLGLELGVARAAGAVLFSIVIGLAMASIFPGEQGAPAAVDAAPSEPQLTLARQAVLLALLVAILVFANWAPSGDGPGGVPASSSWRLAAVAGGLLLLLLVRWLGLAAWRAAAVAVAVGAVALAVPEHPELASTAGFGALAAVLAGDRGELGEWMAATWGFAKQILPLLLVGVLAAGLLLGRPGHEGLIPPEWISSAVGGNSIAANLFAAVVGAFMYFATLTEVPILQGLLGDGMGAGPALALLLAGPALSLPAMLVIATYLGWRRTLVFVSLVVVLSAAVGVLYGFLVS